MRDYLIAAFCCVALAGSAQTSFHAYSSSVNMVEGGTVSTVEVFTGNEHLTVRVPRGLASSVEEEKQRVVFADKTGSMTVTLQITTNSPGTLPADEVLRNLALAANPGGNFLQSGGSTAGNRPAKFVDSFRTVDDHLTVKRRHAFISCPEGMVELVLAANSTDFEKGRVAFGLMLLSFHLELVKPSPAAAGAENNSAPAAPQ